EPVPSCTRTAALGPRFFVGRHPSAPQARRARVDGGAGPDRRYQGRRPALEIRGVPAWGRHRRRRGSLLRWPRWLCALLLWHGPAAAQTVTADLRTQAAAPSVAAAQERAGPDWLAVERPRIRG